MQITAPGNNKGVTLVEVMIALVVLLFVFLGLLQAAILSIESNVRNEVRDAAVQIAVDDITQARTENFVNLVDTTGACNPSPNSPQQRYFRNQQAPIQYNVCRIITDSIALGDILRKQVSVQVSYMYRNEPTTYTMVTTISP